MRTSGVRDADSEVPLAPVAGEPGARFRRRDVVFGTLALVTVVIAWFGFATHSDPYLNWIDDDLRNRSLWGTAVAVLAVAVAGRVPSLSLLLAWIVLGMVGLGCPPQAAIGMTVLTGFACAAWGNRWTLWASALSIPAATFLVAVSLDPLVVSRAAAEFGFYRYGYDLYQVVDWRLVILVVAILALALPWFAGLAVRFRIRSEAAARETAVAEAERDDAAAARVEAEEVAHVREQQAQLARDVHDVVGHSLTVILAQAQAAQFLGDEEQVRASLETIAATAHTSLDDVRRVLASTSGAPVPAPAVEDLHVMLDGVRASGRRVEFMEEGQPRPLPPELATVAHRVLQEMVTNAVRHGNEHEPILVERHWGWDLRLEVANAMPFEPEQAVPPTVVRRVGQGVTGMRRRLESVGGRLDVRIRTGDATRPSTHTVTAWLPLPGTLEGQHRP
ncbi:sensor histidine kinase [Nocardioides yefusunii]|uniref:histidine kinase n=1 Tax=Nocardioides yefusunii TaxID=2500546 RepID=A0ABW1QW79_9ACTN|nr:histidine kinase [Nocardioides yefusunii]